MPPLMPLRLDLNITKPIDRLRSILDACGYKGLHRKIIGTDNDPWLGFRSYQVPGWLNLRDGIIWNLFYNGHLIPEDEFANAFSTDEMEAFIGIGLLSRADGFLRPCVVILVYFDNYIVLDQPQRYASGRWGTGAVYFDAISLDAARHLVPREPIGTFLEIGPGSGLLLIEASRNANLAIGIDIDPFAALISRLNVILNRRNSNTFISVGDIVSALKPGVTFQVIMFHPPYRLVPMCLKYPNPTARVGRGTDGLDVLRRFLREAVNHLQPNGKLLFGCAMPASDQEVPFFSELERFAMQFRSHIKVHVQGTTPVEAQALVTAEKCQLLNPTASLQELVSLILSHYAALGFSRLVLCWVTITAGKDAEVSIE